MIGPLVAMLQVGAAVMLAGYALFRLRMAVSLARSPAGVGADRLHEGLATVRWPPGVAVSMSLDALGWALIAAFAAATLGRGLVSGRGIAPLSLYGPAAVLLVHAFLARAPGRGASAAFFVITLAAIAVGVTPPGRTGGFTLAFGVHVIAAATWLGHMFFWSLVSGPALKRLDDRELGARLRESSLEGGGLGWPALGVLLVTGAYMLWRLGIGLDDLVSPRFLAQRFGAVLDTKLLLVLLMVGYQAVFGHREAPRAIYGNMLVALAVLALAVVLTGV